MSRKGIKNKKPAIIYPRKCEHCDYVSNNPSMYHYHNKIHSSLEGKICDHGCGQPAIMLSTYGKYCCCDSFSKCPGYLKSHSKKVTEQWTRPGADFRKKETAESLRSRLHNREIVERCRKTKWAKWGMENATPEQWKEYRRYARSCRKLAQKWAKDNGHEIGQRTFHVDHIVSVMDGFTKKISPAIMSHPANLRILEAGKNASKGARSDMTIEELLEKIKDVEKI